MELEHLHYRAVPKDLRVEDGRATAHGTHLHQQRRLRAPQQPVQRRDVGHALLRVHAVHRHAHPGIDQLPQVHRSESELEPQRQIAHRHLRVVKRLAELGGVAPLAPRMHMIML